MAALTGQPLHRWRVMKAATMCLKWSIAGVLTAGLGAFSAAAATPVPAGNRNVEQPPVPGSSAKRTRAAQTTYEAKYAKVYRLLKRNGRLIGKIRATAARYGIDPVHMAGAIIGEHTYNVDAYDHLQTYYVKAVSYLKSDFSFSYQGETVSSFVARPEFAKCTGKTDSYTLWSCRESVWERRFRGREVDGRRWPNDRFGAVFFQPLYAGQTFGIGQLNPLTALQMTDIVRDISGLPPIVDSDPQEVYRTIMDPDKSLAYMAATLKKSIDAYREVAGFDISGNPGITATLYNLGDPVGRARQLAAKNRIRTKQGKPVKWPEENYYGWLVNDKLDALDALFSDS